MVVRVGCLQGWPSSWPTVRFRTIGATGNKDPSAEDPTKIFSSNLRHKTRMQEHGLIARAGTSSPSDDCCCYRSICCPRGTAFCCLTASSIPLGPSYPLLLRHRHWGHIGGDGEADFFRRTEES
ncbi:hypothetical protein R1flu_021806 [Riccia fluitans]|uniref:Uncharacterized protein n=1 Tax=Riccia fluitans TaxID=41844 RepID=A0ABD1ZQF9_9MARC